MFFFLLPMVPQKEGYGCNIRTTAMLSLNIRAVAVKYTQFLKEKNMIFHLRLTQ